MKVWMVYAPLYPEDFGWFFSTEEKVKEFCKQVSEHDNSEYAIKSFELDEVFDPNRY